MRNQRSSVSFIGFSLLLFLLDPAAVRANETSRASGDTSEAQSFYAKLEEICLPGADRPELAEAKTYLAQK